VSQDGREYYAPKTLILKKRGIEIKKEITELRITRMAKASGKEFWIRKRAQTDMESLLQRNFRYCKYRAEQWSRSG
jgi:hypothetical protein